MCTFRFYSISILCRIGEHIVELIFLDKSNMSAHKRKTEEERFVITVTTTERARRTELSVPVNHELENMPMIGTSVLSVVVVESQLPIGYLVNPC
jgi:hypothetical protein